VQDSCHNPWTAAAVDHGDNQQGLLVRRVGDQIITDSLKAQRSCGEIGPLVTLVRKGHEVPNGSRDVLTEARGRGGVVLSNELPDFGDVLSGQGEAEIPGGASFRSAPLQDLILAPTEVVKENFTINGLYAAPLDLIVATIKQVA
jgi:hypothetical protein